MSDFLSKFNKDNYEKMLEEEQNIDEQISEKKATIPKKNIEKKATIPKKNIEKKEEIKPEIIEDEIPKEIEAKEEVEISKEPIISSKRSSRTSVSIDEVIEKDPTYNKKQKQKFIMIILAIVLSFSTIGGGIFLINRVAVPNFIEKELSEAKTWALKNRIELEITEEFNLIYDAQIIFEQGKEPTKHLLKGSIMQLKVSKGADPDERLKLPTFTTMGTAAIETWKTTNKADNVKIVKEFSDTVENGKFLRMEFKDKSITAENYYRKDGLTVYVSKGKETFEKNIAVPDFKDKTKSEVETWAKTNEITVHYEEVASDSVMADMIISQSIESGQKIAKKDEISIVVSIGKIVCVPWFGNVPMTQAATYEPNLAVQIVEEYRSNYGYGDFIWQSVGSGTCLTEKDVRNVTVYYSLGKPYINDLELLTEAELPAYFYGFREKGANITYKVHYVSGTHEQRGKVRNASKRLEYVDLNTHVDIYVYQ